MGGCGGHGFASAYFDDYALPLWLRRYRCPLEASFGEDESSVDDTLFSSDPYLSLDASELDQALRAERPEAGVFVSSGARGY